MDTACTANFAEDDEFIKLFSKRPETIKPGLDRIKPAWLKLGMNHYKQLNILVAGTNGKGSTAGLLWHLLSALGVKAGLFTSPHLCLFRERFQCSHNSINQSELKRNLSKIREHLGEHLYGELSFFEVSTLLALRTFNEYECQVNILEVGLGGRLDSTNIVQPIISVVCSIDLDHTEWLGSKLTDIAREKLGICRSGVPLFWGEQFTQEKKLASTLAEFQEKLRIPTFTREKHFGLNLDTQIVWCMLNGKKTEAKLPKWVKTSSPIIKQNFALAYGVYTYIKQQTNILDQVNNINPLEHFASPSLPWPPSLVGRFQDLKVNQTQKDSFNIILDVCHNPAAAKEFVATFKNKGIIGKIPGLVSILDDKDISQILSVLSEVLHPIYFFKVESERSNLEPDKDLLINQSLQVFTDLKSAWDKINKSISCKYYAICGSFFAVADALKLFSAYPLNGHFSSSLKGVWKKDEGISHEEILLFSSKKDQNQTSKLRSN